MKKISGICFFVLMTGCILTHSSLSLAYAALGLTLWYEKNGAGASAVYDPVRHFDPYGHDGQPDPSGKTFVRKNLSPVSTGNLCDPDGLFVRFSHGCPHCLGISGQTRNFFGGRTISAGLLQQSGTSLFPGICTAAAT